MKRALIIILIVAAIVGGFLTINGSLPFVPVFGTSMEPTYKAGDLLTIESVDPADIEVGDVIIFEVPAAVREYYNYPQMVAHRVIKINDEYSMSFRTKGDNTGEDPFTVRAQDIRGTVSSQIPYLGFPLLFLQSTYGLIFIIVALCLLTIFLYSSEISHSRHIIQRRLFAPVVEESQRTTRVLSQKLDTTGQLVGGTQQALDNFSKAMNEYAYHLHSHTSAIQGLSEASQELKKSSAEQNKVLSDLVKVNEQLSPRVAPKIVTKAELQAPQDNEPEPTPVIVEAKPEPRVKKVAVHAPQASSEIIRHAGTEQVVVEVNVSPKFENVVVREQPQHTTRGIADSDARNIKQNSAASLHIPAKQPAEVEEKSEANRQPAATKQATGTKYPPGCFRSLHHTTAEKETSSFAKHKAKLLKVKQQHARIKA